MEQAAPNDGRVVERGFAARILARHIGLAGADETVDELQQLQDHGMVAVFARFVQRRFTLLVVLKTKMIEIWKND